MAGSSKWAWSKSTRIKVMLIIDTAFFLLELISGFVAHSLALTADAFHMLNDIISLFIGLWAVVASQKKTTDEYTFGWLRAEILGAFFNAVFLIALCVSIVIEALTRLIDPPAIDNPKLILIVGCAGLASNLLGFVVLGGHGHSHGDGHDHSHHDDTEAAVGSVAQAAGSAGEERADIGDTARHIRFGDETAGREASDSKGGRTPGQSRGRGQRRSSKSGHSRFASIEDLSIHPASFRQDIIAVASSTNNAAEADSSEESPLLEPEAVTDEETPLLRTAKCADGGGGNSASKAQLHQPPPRSSSAPQKRVSRRDSSVHDGHHHTLPKKQGAQSHGHGHGDMGMRAMMLHVLGDALGNVGVIATALIIWLTDWPGKFYADPAVSLFITVIILRTSIPLTLATARVLLQATPENISISEIRQDIERLPGVVSCHHIHVWQLSDIKVVASLHLEVSFPISTQNGDKYMQLAKRARKCLHGYGIHSATIQPEFCVDRKQQHDRDATALTMDGGGNEAAPAGQACLLECIEDCQVEGCCPGQESSKTSLPGEGCGPRPQS